jgi:hypothetical protein
VPRRSGSRPLEHPRLDPTKVEEKLGDQDDKHSDASEVDLDPESENIESDDEPEREVMEPTDVPAADSAESEPESQDED